MGNSLGLWSEPSPEERVVQNHHNDLQQVIINPLHVASKLLQEGVVSRALVSEVNTLGRSQLQNSTAIITAVTASIHSKPDQFQVFMSVLEDRTVLSQLIWQREWEMNWVSRAMHARGQIDFELILYCSATTMWPLKVGDIEIFTYDTIFIKIWRYE